MQTVDVEVINFSQPDVSVTFHSYGDWVVNTAYFQSAVQKVQKKLTRSVFLDVLSGPLTPHLLARHVQFPARAWSCQNNQIGTMGLQVSLFK